MTATPIDGLTVGAITARPVVTPSGLTLVGAGTVLTPALIGRLKSMGVGTVWVVGNASESPGPTVEERLAALHARFAPHADDPLMKELRDALARQLREWSDAANRR